MGLLPLALATIAVAFFTGSDSLFYLAYALAGLAIVSRLWTRQSVREVRVERRIVPPDCAGPATQRAFYGEKLTVQLRVTNRGRLPVPWLYAHESIPIALHTPNFERRVLSLSPGETACIEYELACARRGYYELGPLSLRTGDLLGISPEQECSVATDPLIVYPRIMPLQKLGLPSQLPFGTVASRQRIFEDPSRFFGVREYAPSDSLRQIHWKSSARTDQLQTKRFQPAIALDTMVFLDLNFASYDLYSRAMAGEMGITIAASIAAHLIEARQPVGLALLGADAVSGFKGMQTAGPAHGRGHLMQLLERLARVEMADTEAFPALLAAASARMTWGSTAVVIVPGDEAGLLPALLHMQRQGLQVTVIATDPLRPFGEFESRLKQAGMSAFRGTRDSDLDTFQGHG